MGHRSSLAAPSGMPPPGTTGIHDLTAAAVHHWISDHDARDQASLGPNARRCQPAGTDCWLLARCGQEPLDCCPPSPHAASTACHVLTVGHGASLITGCTIWYAAAGNHWNSRLDRCGRASLDLRSRCPRSGSTGTECLAAPACRHWLLATCPVRPRTTGLLPVVAACGKHRLSRLDHGAWGIAHHWLSHLLRRGREPLEFTT